MIRLCTIRLAALTLAAAAALPAAGGLHAQDLPEASAVIARYQQAVGGKDVLAGFNSMHAVGEFSVPAQGLVASIAASSARPNRSSLRVEIAGFGEMRTGNNGDVVWSLNPMEGPRLLQGAEKTQADEEGMFEASLRTDAVIRSATTVERTRIAGQECLKVRLVWLSGRETHDCYSEETGLLIGILTTQQTAMGPVEAVTLYEDYREVNGFRMPMRMTVQAMGIEQIITFREITFDSVPDSAFDLPAEIRALIRQ
jgi:hypothetical protein